MCPEWKRMCPHLLHVPEEICLFHAHEGHSSSRPNNEDRATCTSTVRNELPELSIRWHLVQGVHPHGGSHQWYIVNDCRGQANCTGDDLHTAHMAVQKLSQLLQKASRVQAKWGVVREGEGRR